MSLEQLREYIVVKCPRMKAAVARIPPTGKYPNDMGRTELEELKELEELEELEELKSLH